MPPAVHAVSIRSLVVVAVAALGGLLIGGVSVLGIVVAVTEPPNRDAPPGSAVFDGPHVVDRQADSRPAAAPAQPAPPLAVQSAPSQALSPTPSQDPSPADVLQQAWPTSGWTANTPPAKPWPDALSARNPQAPESAGVKADQGPDTPAPAAAANAEHAAGSGDTDNRGTETANNASANSVRVRPVKRNASRNSAPGQVAPNAVQYGRRIVTAPANDQQARGDAEDEASPEDARPLFDFFGRPDDSADYREVPDAGRQPAPQQLQPGRSVNGRGNQLARQQQQRVIIRDQDAVPPPAPNDNWGSFFSHDDWNDDRRY